MAENSIAVAERLEREHSGQEVGIIATLYLASRDRIAQLERKLHAVGEVLAKQGCFCECDHDSDSHEESCERCYGCLVGEALDV